MYKIIGKYKLQEGFQVKAAKANAQINILGGVKGCGKTYLLLLLPFISKYINQPTFEGAIFRRIYSEITNPGGLLSESDKMYVNMLGKRAKLKWTFPTGATIEFRAMQHEKDVLKYAGSQIPFIGMDELPLFTSHQFWTMLGNNRSATIKDCVFYGTCNPDPDSFVKKLIEWYIDTDGYPIWERSGINRYFFRHNEHLIWGGSRSEVITNGGEALDEIKFNEKKAGRDFKELIKSITFVPGKLEDNKILNDNNPEYRANMYNMSEEWKMRNYYGNWKIKIAKDMLFNADAIEGMFDYQPPQSAGRFITCDPAGLGHDLMVIYVWFGWCVTVISIQQKSTSRGIYEEIERLRNKYSVMRNKVIVDADGVYNDVVKLGNYKAFHGGAKCKYDETINKREYYKNYKTQCYYRIAKRANEGKIGIMVTHDCLWVNGVVSHNILIDNQVIPVYDVMKKHIRAIRIANIDHEGKHSINTKDEQKIILDGASPDFADTLMMREDFEFDKPVY